MARGNNDGKKPKKSSLRNIGAFVCPRCNRVFSNTSNKLVFKLKKRHLERCEVFVDSEAPSVQKVLESKRHGRMVYKGK
jgi:hypothetical protein